MFDGIRYSLELKEFYCYRAEGDKPVTLYKGIPGNGLQFIDSQVSMNTTYCYYLKVVMEGGADSVFSEKLEVGF